MTSASTLIKKALDCDELIECFLGEGKYNTSNRMDPSNISENRILKGIQELYESDEIPMNQVSDTLIQIMDLGPSEYYVAFSYIAFYLDLKSRNKISFSFDINRLANYSAKKIVDYGPKLKAMNEVDRVSFRGNVYEQIKKTNEILKSSFGVDLLEKKETNND